MIGRIFGFFKPAKVKKNGDIHDVIVVALPMLLSMSFDTLMTFVDRLFLSKLGPAEMNASSSAGGMNMVLTTFFTGMISYTTAMVAQRFGAGKKNECASVFMQAVYLSFACVPFLYLTIPLGHFIFEHQGVAADQLVHQNTYFNILMLGGVVSLVRNAAPCFFSGIGETKIIMKAAFVGMLVNIVCNYFLIFGVGPFPRLGVAGAAYGTVIGNIVSTAMLFIVYFSKKNHCRFATRSNLKVNFEQVKELLSRGLPSGVEMFLNMAAFQLMILIDELKKRMKDEVAHFTFRNGDCRFRDVQLGHGGLRSPDGAGSCVYQPGWKVCGGEAGCSGYPIYTIRA